MLRVKQRFAGSYTLDADVADRDGMAANVTSAAVVITGSDGVEVFRGVPDADLKVYVPVTDMPPGVYLAAFTGFIDGQPQEWRVWFEVVPAPAPASVTYGHYLSFGHKLSEAVFDEHIIDAIAKVNAAIGDNPVTDATSEAYKRAVCAVVDVLESPPLTSRVSGRTSESQNPADLRTAARIIREHLANTGLLYSGL